MISHPLDFIELEEPVDWETWFCLFQQRQGEALLRKRGEIYENL